MSADTAFVFFTLSLNSLVMQVRPCRRTDFSGDRAELTLPPLRNGAHCGDSVFTEE